VGLFYGRVHHMTDHEVIQNLHRRMDTQDKILLEIRDTITAHIATEATIKPAIEELVTLWKGSKLIIPMMVAAALSLWGFVEWAMAHIK
jgi:hypothetical protein